jgi:MFS transporter, AAHS family, benzoate transport protein
VGKVRRRVGLWSCAGFAVALDGFDLVVLGAVTPALLEYQEWGLTAPQVGAITSYGLFGMLIGRWA